MWPDDWITTAGLIAATLCGLLACAVAIKRVCCVGKWDRAIERAAVFAIALLAGGVFIYRAVVLHHDWVPVQAHVDGMALLAALLGLVIGYLQWTDRLKGVDVFGLPVLTLLALWGVCASWWTARPFGIESLWMAVHLLSVYVGTLGVATAAAAGALWLYVDRQLRKRDHRAERLRLLGRLGNLESIEQAIIRAATAGFLLLTVGLVTGLIVATAEADVVQPGWWYSPKVVLAAAVWAIFALIMHVRFVPTFRGRRAAVLSIVGLVLVIAIFGIAQAVPAGGTATPDPEVTSSEPAASSAPNPGPSTLSTHPSAFMFPDDRCICSA